MAHIMYSVAIVVIRKLLAHHTPTHLPSLKFISVSCFHLTHFKSEIYYIILTLHYTENAKTSFTVILTFKLVASAHTCLLQYKVLVFSPYRSYDVSLLCRLRASYWIINSLWVDIAS